MRLVCMVPSLTETLIECGFDVVGRTRYCVHPKAKVDAIAIVGGTKDISWDKVKVLQPDLLIFDQEENPKRFADQSSYPWWACHIEGVNDVPRDLQKLYDFLLLHINAEVSCMEKLSDIIRRWQKVLTQKSIHQPWSKFPGVIEWFRQPEDSWRPKRILYLIWRNPWMSVSKDTFIGSMLEQFGCDLVLEDTKYPKLNLLQHGLDETLVLYSSEPYLFAKEKDELKALGFYSALVDGEKFSWFGLRSLRFLESESN